MNSNEDLTEIPDTDNNNENRGASTDSTANDNSNSNTNQVSNLTYPAASLMLDISRSEFMIERERSNNIDNKANIFITIIITLITIYIPIMPLSSLKEIYKQPYNNNVVTATICICFLVLSVISLTICLYNLIGVISLKPFQRMNFENLNDEQILKASQNEVERGLLDHYNTILTNNVDINDKKADKISLGIKYWIIFFCLLSVSTIILLIITS